MKRIHKLFLLTLTLTYGQLSHCQIWDFAGVNQLGGEVNSVAEESLPIFSKDSALLYFIRTMDKRNKGGEYDQDIWLSYRRADGTYGDCKQEGSLNSKYNNGVVGMSADGSEIYLLNTYEGKKDMEKGIAVARKKGNSWGTPEKIDVPTLDIEGDFYGFHISEDGNVMLISFQGAGTLGLEDIYVSLKSDQGWSAPINIGSDINTTGFEMSPFLSKNLDTLFFSSNGHGGEGDADIFYSVRKDSWTSWNKPVNLGKKINSTKFDACFSYSGNTVYWASNRDGELSDIYTAFFVFPPPLVVSCSAKDATFYQGTDGRIDLAVEGGAAPYNFTWSNGMQSEDITGLSKGDYTVVVRDDFRQEAIATCSVNEPAPVVFEPVDVATWKNQEFMHYFDYNKNKLAVSKGDLKKFVKELENQLKSGRPKVTINVYSSASTVPTKTYESNEKLSQMRAENMKYDLVTYFESKPEFAGKVNVVIVSAIVDGPEYVQDADEIKKYKPYQFVGLKTE
jgi:hypothetical protein